MKQLFNSENVVKELSLTELVALPYSVTITVTTPCKRQLRNLL